MKSLVESILSSTGSGRSSVLWDSFIDILKSMKDKDEFFRCYNEEIYIPKFGKRDVPDVFMFKVEKSKSKTRHRAIVKFLQKNGYKHCSTREKMEPIGGGNWQFVTDLDIFNIGNNEYYIPFEEHFNKYWTMIDFKIDNTVVHICEVKEGGYEWFYIAFFGNKDNLAKDVVEKVKKELGG